HCYVVWQGERIDITRRVNAPEAITKFLYEERVSPKNVAPYKMRIHRQCLNEWRGRGGTRPVKYSLEELWRIREECVAALDRASTTSAEFRTLSKDGHHGRQRERRTDARGLSRSRAPRRPADVRTLSRGCRVSLAPVAAVWRRRAGLRRRSAEVDRDM